MHSKKKWLSDQIYPTTLSHMFSFTRLFSVLSKSHLISFHSVSGCLTHAITSTISLMSTFGAWISLSCTNCRCQSVNHLKKKCFPSCLYSVLFTLYPNYYTGYYREPFNSIIHSWTFLMALYITFNSPILAHHPAPQKGLTIIGLPIIITL